MSFDDPHFAFSHLNAVLEALVLELQTSKVPPMCTYGIAPGAVTALDYINDECSSYGWSRLATLYPSNVFPQPDQLPYPRIPIAFQIELGIIRAIELDRDGEPPTMEEQFETTRLQHADMEAMLRVLCAYPDALDMPALIGTYAPIGPEGAVVGGTWTATFGAL